MARRPSAVMPPVTRLNCGRPSARVVASTQRCLPARNSERPSRSTARSVAMCFARGSLRGIFTVPTPPNPPKSDGAAEERGEVVGGGGTVGAGLLCPEGHRLVATDLVGDRLTRSGQQQLGELGC